MNNENVVLRVQGASKQFSMPGGKFLNAVSDVSFDIRQGECLAVIGESGCGKSTLAKLISGVRTPTNGEVIFMGENIVGISEHKMRNVRRNMQMIFQNAGDAVSPRMKVKTFLLEPWLNFKIADKETARKSILEMLGKVRLGPEVLERYPHQLSGGELQRVCVARAFAMHPSFLICDEITSALDVSVQDDVMKLFRQIQQETGTACLFICHDLALVNQFSDRVMVMYLGQAVEIMDSTVLGTRALHPYTQGLLKAVFFIGNKQKGRTVSTLKGEPPSPVNLPKGCRFCGRCPKATEKCRQKIPALREVEPDHYVACHMFQSISKERNCNGKNK